MIKQLEFFEEHIGTVVSLTDKSSLRPMIVAGKSGQKLSIYKEILNSGFESVVLFDGFKPNPTYESVVEGVSLFRKNDCNFMIAVGGGSAMDVAKSIVLFSGMEGNGEDGSFLKQLTDGYDYAESYIPILAIPTTAGTGSEATRFAVIYYDGMKQSVAHDLILPEYVLLRSELLKDLPVNQRKATAMDALCHSIESFWSVNSTKESREIAEKAISIILNNLSGYIMGDEEASAKMLKASNLAGKAINITQTTAGHAMCYQLTHLYGLSHGYAAALCVKALWPYMRSHTHLCADQRGTEYLWTIFKRLDELFGGAESAIIFAEIVDSLELERPVLKDSKQLDILVKSVNPDRLRNNPVILDEDAIKKIYIKIMEEK